METKYITRLLEENNAKTELILRKIEAIIADLYSLSAAAARIEQNTSEGDDNNE